MAPGGCDDNGCISDEARLLAAGVRARAATAPTEDAIRALADQALRSPGRDMTPDQIRDLTNTAVSQAQQVSELLGRLAGLLGDAGSADEPR